MSSLIHDIAAWLRKAPSLHGILGLAPLLTLAAGVLGWWVDQQVVERGLVMQVSLIAGEHGSAVLRQVMATVQGALQPEFS